MLYIFPIFVTNHCHMQNIDQRRSVQTAFRFTPELVNGLKAKARAEGKSVNSLVEEILTEALGSIGSLEEKLSAVQIPAYVSEGTKAFKVRGFDFSACLDDERAQYILGK